ncbi:hypothetical protein G7046_g5964 [Stylonectria norvegica]|nr:hypothetical protein G7046_g5964 [Stylonectria norvegica]
MDDVTHDIDPDGDTIIILHNANAPFAAQEGEEWPQMMTARPSRALTAAMEAFYNMPNAVEMIAESGHDEAVPRPDSESEEPEIESEKPEVDSGKPEVEPEEPKIRFRVSSKHLVLASAYFRKMLAGPWSESERSPGSDYIVNATDWDEEAMLVLLNIIHGHTRKVPRVVELELMAKFAVLVDYYQCLEVVERYAESWLGRLKTSYPGPRDETLRFFISWVFLEPAAFRSTSKALLMNARGPFHTWDLPFPQEILGSCEKHRQQRLGAVLAAIYEVFEQLQDDVDRCSYECSSILLGALTKRLYKWRILEQRPTEPYLGWGFSDLQNSLSNIRELQWPDEILHDCSLSKILDPVVVSSAREFGGLELKQFSNASSQEQPPDCLKPQSPKTYLQWDDHIYVPAYVYDSDD